MNMNDYYENASTGSFGIDLSRLNLDQAGQKKWNKSENINHENNDMRQALSSNKSSMSRRRPGLALNLNISCSNCK